jgi:hypothetical protein
MIDESEFARTVNEILSQENSKSLRINFNGRNFIITHGISGIWRSKNKIISFPNSVWEYKLSSASNHQTAQDDSMPRQTDGGQTNLGTRYRWFSTKL